MLPVAIRNMLPKPVREALVRLCDFFNAIYQKVIDPFKLDRLQEDVVKTICQLEMFFPPSFFDVMVHLIVHIVYEIKQCGPVYLRTMYPFERFMGILKHYVRNRYRPEASIVEGYLSEEVVEYFISYMDGHRPIGVPLSRHEGRLDFFFDAGNSGEDPHCVIFSFFYKDKYLQTVLGQFIKEITSNLANLTCHLSGWA